MFRHVTSVVITLNHYIVRTFHVLTRRYIRSSSSQRILSVLISDLYAFILCQ